MIKNTNIIANDNVYLKHHCPIKQKELDVFKLRKLLFRLGINPVVDGTTFIIEELKYMIENDIKEIKNMKQLYEISARTHNISVENVQWNVKSAIDRVKWFADKTLLKKICYWYDTDDNITPRFFMRTLLEYRQENYDEYKNN